jgi:hypothetical protein
MEQFTDLIDAVVCIVCFGTATVVVETFVQIFKSLTK